MRKARTADHAPALPSALFARTRQKRSPVAGKDVVSADAVTVWLTRLDVKPLVLLTWNVYVAAPATSAQSKATELFGANRAEATGDSSDGAGSGSGGGADGLTVKVTDFVTPAPDTVNVTVVETAAETV
jgi:hypothetical protein